MITYDDPIGRVLEFVASTYSVTAHVRIVHRSELPRLPWRLKRAKGVTLWADAVAVAPLLPKANAGMVSPALVLIDARLSRGVEGTLDILAHELAHVVAGFDEGHGERWQEVYAAIFDACVEEPVVVAAYPRYS